jgi:hypothetical protein
VGGQPGFELGKSLRHVAAAIAKTDVARLVIDGARKEEDTGLADESLAEGVDICLRKEVHKTDGAGVRRLPREEIRAASEEGTELEEIAVNDLEIAVDEFLAVPEGEGGEKFTGGAGADGGVVLEGNDFLKDRRIATSQPSKAQSGKAVGFAD